MVFFVPIDQTTLKVNLPFDSYIDRIVVILMILAWALLGGDQRTFARSRRSKLYVSAAGFFLVVAIASLLLDSARVINLNEWTIAQKQFALIASFFALGWFALTALRFEDLPGMASLLIGLATIMAIGIMVERRTGYNVFYSLSGTILSPIAHVNPPSTNVNLALSTDDRLTIDGPTSTGLAATAMLAMVLPFALVRLFNAPTRASWRRNALASLLIMSAAMATDKKSSLLVPLIVVIYLGFHYPRKMARLAPLAIVLLGFVHIASPGALGTLLNPAQWFGSNSTVHRQGDLSAIMPDVLAHPVFGRGLGSIDVTQPSQFRILDDQLLGVLWQVGVVGLAAYVWMIISPIVAARRARRSPEETYALLAVAASAGCIAYLVVNGLFDALAFDQVPYLFFVIAAFCTVLSGGPVSDPVPRAYTAFPRARAVPA